jgi:hypothetical protein
MKRPKLVAAVLWLLVLADAVRQGVMLDPLFRGPGLRFQGVGLFIAVMPVLFFSTAPLWMKGHPFDVKRLREYVNRRFGPEVYESYTRAIQPLALFGTAGLTLGATILTTAALSGWSEGAYVHAAFFVSSGFGFHVARVILRKQGISIE